MTRTSDTPSPLEAAEALVQIWWRAHADTPGALLPLLHAVQDGLGHVPAGVVPLIARLLNLSRAEVHGVITYYHFFRGAPPGRHVVQFCRAEACQACGADELLAQAERILGCASHSTRADGAVSLEPGYSLGVCATSPAHRVDERLQARMDPDRLQALAQAMGVAA